jgi:5-oxoprolinase (ATP-hydrolysing) subunit A
MSRLSIASDDSVARVQKRRRPDRVIDLNADLGEEITDDVGLLAVVSSANVACGYHAGSADTMRSVCAEAARLGISIGAQVSYDDRENFGRIRCDVAPHTLQEQIADQVGRLSEIARSEGIKVRYLKPHGALYHRVIDDRVQAAAVLQGSGSLPVLGFPEAVILDLATQKGRTTYLEAFADRRYASDGQLTPRGEPEALVTDTIEIGRQATQFAERVDSICIHGDTPDAVVNARAVRQALDRAGWMLQGL